MEKNIASAQETGGVKFGIIDTQGKWFVPPIYDELGLIIDNDLIKAKYKGRYGFINTNGNFVIQPKFKDIAYFSNHGLALAQDDSEKWGFINKQGEWVIQPVFEYAFGFNKNGLAFVWYKEDGPMYFINTKGEIVVTVEHIDD